MSTISHDSDSDDIFGHLLDYQQTNEFETDTEAQHERDLSKARPRRREAAKRYREKFP